MRVVELGSVKDIHGLSVEVHAETYIDSSEIGGELRVGNHVAVFDPCDPSSARELRSLIDALMILERMSPDL